MNYTTEQLHNRLSTLRKECARVRRFQCLCFDLKYKTIEWYEHEIECCKNEIEWNKTALEREENKNA